MADPPSSESALRTVRRPDSAEQIDTREADPESRGRVIVERIWPEIDGGRFPIKRTVGERVTVGADIFAWPALAIDQVELSRTSMQSGDTSTLVHIIERLSVKAGSRSVTLDRAMLENGLLLVDNAWRKLRPATP